MITALEAIWGNALHACSLPYPKNHAELDAHAGELERAIFDAVEREMPELWRACYPRIYTDPKCGQYYSSKKPARQLASIAMKVAQRMVGQSEQYEFQLASHLAKFRVPMYWLSQDIAEALKKTTPPGEFNWYTMPMPFEAAVFMMPKGSLVHRTDGNVPFICYARLPQGVEYRSPLVRGHSYGSVNGTMLLAAAVETKYFLHWNIPLDAFGPCLTMAQLHELMMQYRTDEHRSSLPLSGGGGMTEADHDLGLAVAHYIFSTLMVMTARPELLTAGKLTNKVPAKKGREPREFWSPHIIGEHYKLRREPAPSQGGTHASPRFHWVQGFLREQPFGPGRTQRYIKWIEPYTRGLDRTEER